MAELPIRSTNCPTTSPPPPSAAWCATCATAHDAQNIELMGLAGFCRNCLADWIRDAGFEGDKAAAREVIHGMPMDEWKDALPDRSDARADRADGRERRAQPGHLTSLLAEAGLGPAQQRDVLLLDRR